MAKPFARKPFARMVDVIPPGTCGKARVTHAVPTELAAFLSATEGQALKAGVPIARLHVDNVLMMSDGADEQRSNTAVVHHASGDVLIAGLGIGMILVPILAKSEVRHVHVVECSADVITLVEKPLRAYVGKVAASKLVVEQASIFDYMPLSKLTKWDTIYFDIWPDICTDNLPEIAKLKRRFARRLRAGGWMRAWQEDYLRVRRQRERVEEASWR